MAQTGKGQNPVLCTCGVASKIPANGGLTIDPPTLENALGERHRGERGGLQCYPNKTVKRHKGNPCPADCSTIGTRTGAT